MPIRTLLDLDLTGRRVFVRADFDVPLTPAGGIVDPTRLEQALPTLKHCLELGCRVIVASTLGRPQGHPDPKFSLEPVAAFLAERLRRDVLLTDEPTGDGARKVVADVREGQLAVLENLAFSPGEAANEDGFARALAAYADVYINDAFGVTHLAHASTAGMVRHFGDRGVGLVMERELSILNQLKGEPLRPACAVIGGANVNEKIGVLESLLGKFDAIYMGGAMANTFLRARGGHLGRSLREDDKLATARFFLRKADDRGVRVHLPSDLVAAAGVRSESGRVVPAMNVPDDLAALDLGPETIRRYAEDLSRARTVFWNGPLGAYEHAPFSEATRDIARAIGRAVGALTVVSGAETALAVHRAGAADHFSHVSSAGAAMLRALEGKPLPGLDALESPARV